MQTIITADFSATVLKTQFTGLSLLPWMTVIVIVVIIIIISNTSSSSIKRQKIVQSSFQMSRRNVEANQSAEAAAVCQHTGGSSTLDIKSAETLASDWPGLCYLFPVPLASIPRTDLRPAVGSRYEPVFVMEPLPQWKHEFQQQ